MLNERKMFPARIQSTSFILKEPTNLFLFSLFVTGSHCVAQVDFELPTFLPHPIMTPHSAKACDSLRGPSVLGCEPEG